MENLWLVLIAGISYLLGAIPFSYIVGKMYHQDLRLKGSGNVGAMNVWRSTKKKTPLILALVGDMGKGALIIYICLGLDFLGYLLWVGIMTAAFFAVLGHNYPVFLKFKGGKGLATGAGILLAMHWQIFLVAMGLLLASIFLIELLLKGGIKLEGSWKQKSKALFVILGAQTKGRLIGICLALLVCYSLYQALFYMFLPAGFLILFKHLDTWDAPENLRRT